MVRGGERVEAAWKAVARAGIRRQRDAEAVQQFTDYSELEAKLASQGPLCMERIDQFREQSAISIPMPYRLSLL